MLFVQTGYAVPASASGGFVDQLLLVTIQLVPELVAEPPQFQVTVLNGTHCPPDGWNINRSSKLFYLDFQ
jgi:hypothetical protein